MQCRFNPNTKNKQAGKQKNCSEFVVFKNNQKPNKSGLGKILRYSGEWAYVVVLFTFF
jgi:hypothetical protein